MTYTKYYCSKCGIEMDIWNYLFDWVSDTIEEIGLGWTCSNGHHTKEALNRFEREVMLASSKQL